MIITGDLNARMKDEFISRTEDTKINPHGRSWIKKMKPTTLRPLPNNLSRENTYTYRNENGHRSTPDHVLMNKRLADELVISTMNWNTTKMFNTDHTMIEIILDCLSREENSPHKEEGNEKRREKRVEPPLYIYEGAIEELTKQSKEIKVKQNGPDSTGNMEKRKEKEKREEKEEKGEGKKKRIRSQRVQRKKTQKAQKRKRRFQPVGMDTHRVLQYCTKRRNKIKSITIGNTN